MMELTDYIVYLWLLPVALQLLIPLVLSCFGLVFAVLKHLGLNMIGDKETALQESTA